MTQAAELNNSFSVILTSQSKSLTSTVYLFAIVQFQACKHHEWLGHFYHTRWLCVDVNVQWLIAPHCLTLLGHIVLFLHERSNDCTHAEIEKMSLGEYLGRLPSSVCIIPDLFLTNLVMANWITQQIFSFLVS